MKQSNVIKFVPRNENFNEDLVMVQNLQQMIDALVLKHGAHLVLANLPSMVQDAQTKARASRQEVKQRKVGS
jgi:nitrogen fixation protein